MPTVCDENTFSEPLHPFRQDIRLPISQILLQWFTKYKPRIRNSHKAQREQFNQCLRAPRSEVDTLRSLGKSLSSQPRDWVSLSHYAFSNECKKRKVKCDGRRPCQRCTRHPPTSCVYTEREGTVVSRQEKYVDGLYISFLLT